MSEGDLVKLKSKYPIWLYSHGLIDGDMGIVISMEKETATVFWLRIRMTGTVSKALLLPVT